MCPGSTTAAPGCRGRSRRGRRAPVVSPARRTGRGACRSSIAPADRIAPGRRSSSRTGGGGAHDHRGPVHPAADSGFVQDGPAPPPQPVPGPCGEPAARSPAGHRTSPADAAGHIHRPARTPRPWTPLAHRPGPCPPPRGRGGERRRRRRDGRSRSVGNRPLRQTGDHGTAPCRITLAPRRTSSAVHGSRRVTLVGTGGHAVLQDGYETSLRGRDVGAVDTSRAAVNLGTCLRARCRSRRRTECTARIEQSSGVRRWRASRCRTRFSDVTDMPVMPMRA